MKTILIFSTTYFPLVGGAEVALKEITDRLPNWKFDLICAKIRPGLPATEKIGNVTVHRCGFGHPVDKYLLPVMGVWKAMSLDLTLPSPSLGEGSAGRQTSLLTKEGMREVSVSFIWSLMASYGGFTALVYTWFRPKTKMLLTLQEGDPLEHYAKRMGVFSFLHRAIFKRADNVQAISKFLADWSVKMGFRGTPDVVPNGVDIKTFTARISIEERSRLRTQLGYVDQDVVLCTTSRLSLKNGVDDLVRSLQHLPSEYKVLIIGEGEDRESLQKVVDSFHLESRVQFLGKKSHAELPALLQASDIFVRPSLSEGLGNSFLEAMAAGLPIVGTPVGGIPDFLTDGETGVFCQPRDPRSIAEAVLRIQNELGLREKLIRQGEVLVKTKYDWHFIVQKMEGLFNQIEAS